MVFLPRNYSPGLNDSADLGYRRSNQAPRTTGNRTSGRMVGRKSACRPGAIRKDVEAALALLVEEPGIGTKVETKRPDIVRRLYLTRVQYFIYYRVRGKFLDVVAFWHASRETGPSL